MSWIRYDDQFHSNPKITAVVAEDPGALALHVLANTWTNAQKRDRMGHIPAHQPVVLLCDRELGSRWSALLVRHGLWHEVANLHECKACLEEYGHLPEDIGGYVVHNSAEYRAPDRDRTTPGTPAELSEKRRKAGRAGGRATAKKREQAQQDAGAAQQDNASKDSKLPLAGVSKASNLLSAGVSPEPEPEPSEEPSVLHVMSGGEAADASGENEFEDADCEDAEDDGRADDPGEAVREDVERICQHLADRVTDNGSRRPRITKTWRDEARRLLDLDKRTEDQVHRAIDWSQSNNFWRRNVLSMPTLRKQYDRLRLDAEEELRQKRLREEQRADRPPRSTTDERVAQAQALKAELRSAAERPPPDSPPVFRVIPGEVA